MANSFVQVPPDSTGKSVDTWTTAVLGYHRQGIVIGDPSTDANVIPISSRLRLPVELEQQLDYDTGGGTITVSMVGIALPGSGAIVAGGTATNPIRIDPTGTTIQPVSGTVTTGGLTDVQLRATPVPVSGTVAVTGVATEAKQDSQITEETAIKTAVQIMDDWDETDRAKVNLIAGQVAITAGAGNVAANTPRTTLAADDPAVSVLGATTGAKVITDANGTIQQYLRGLIYQAITNAPLKQIIGTAQTLFDSATDIAAGNFSAAGTNFDNTSDTAVPLAPYALAMIELPDWAAAPAVGTVMELWGTLINTDGTDDDTDPPSGTSSGGARYFGSWPVAAADALQRRTIVISLEGVQSGFTPYIKNGTAQNLNNDGGTNMVLKLTPFSYAPKVN